jgi:hypothetical protein
MHSDHVLDSVPAAAQDNGDCTIAILSCPSILALLDIQMPRYVPTNRLTEVTGLVHMVDY